MRDERIAALKAALSERLEGVQDSNLKIRARKLKLDISRPTASSAEATLTLVFLTRVPGVYLQLHVVKGALEPLLAKLELPPHANNLLAPGVFCLSTLSERNHEFSPDIGGAILVNQSHDVHALADSIVQKIRARYVPLARSILTLTPDLGENVVRYAEYFSYPLTILALLRKLGVSATYDTVVNAPEHRRRFKKERALNMAEILAF